jgi:predicted DNA-binding transcriptional regulator AlpA
MEAKMETMQPEVTGRRSPTRRGRLSPTSKVMERYSCSDRTIDRWVADPDLNFPKPIYIKRRRFWFDDQLDEFDASRVEGA